MIATSLILAASMTCSAAAGVSQDAKEPCCFTNPRYTGMCRQDPQDDETCGSIVGYLNNPNAVGKAYCGNTTVRGGWQQVACDQAEGQSTVATDPGKAGDPS